MIDHPEELKDAIREWWASNQMTYGLEHGITDYSHPDGRVEKVTMGSKRFFEVADETFYRWNEPRHSGRGKFAKIFDYDRYRGLAVLEVGCGMGCMAMNWAMQGAKVTSVDLNPVAIERTRNRFRLFGLEGEIREADAERLPFADNTFAFAYSWGVLHHSPNPQRSIAELLRVLRPGGRVGVMLYNRHSFLYRYAIKYAEGFANIESRVLTELELASRYSDGDRREGNPHTWPVTAKEVRRKLFRQFSNVRIEVFGTDVPGILNQWFPGLGTRLMPRCLVHALERRWGWSLWITGEKPS